MNYSNYNHINSIKNMTFSVQTIDKGEQKWGHESPPRGNEEFMRYSAKWRRALFDTVYSFVREHFANGEGLDPDDLNFSINPAMIYHINCKHCHAKLCVSPMREN